MVFNNIVTWSENVKTGDLVEMVDKIPYYKSPMTRINAALRLVLQEGFPPRRYKSQSHRTKVCIAKALSRIVHGRNKLRQLTISV